MKTVTAKEFQLQHASILREVAKGHEYEVTFHRKPIAQLIPVNRNTIKKTVPGTLNSFMNSLQYSVQSSGDIHDLAYKELRKKMVTEKYDG